MVLYSMLHVLCNARRKRHDVLPIVSLLCIWSDKLAHGYFGPKIVLKYIPLDLPFFCCQGWNNNAHLSSSWQPFTNSGSQERLVPKLTTILKPGNL